MEKIIFFLLACFAWQGSVASAVELEQGIKLFEQKKYDQAKKLWQPLAEKGDARAQYNMVILFLKMQNKVPTDLQRQQANQYLAMSRSEGLVDGYFVTIPEIKLKGDDIDESLTWLNQQIKSTYTLQLATGKSRKSLEKMQKKLISSQSLAQPDNIYIHKTEKKVQDKSVVRYILVYGVFKTYQNAQDEAGKLPESIQKSKPWIRQLGVIQSIVSSKQKNKKT